MSAMTVLLNGIKITLFLRPLEVLRVGDFLGVDVDFLRFGEVLRAFLKFEEDEVFCTFLALVGLALLRFLPTLTSVSDSDSPSDSISGISYSPFSYFIHNLNARFQSLFFLASSLYSLYLDPRNLAIFFSEVQLLFVIYFVRWFYANIKNCCNLQ